MSKHHIQATVLQQCPLHVTLHKNKHAVSPAVALAHLRTMYTRIPSEEWKIDRNRSAHRTLAIHQPPSPPDDV